MFQRVQPGEPISASDYNRALQEVERGGRVRVSAPLTLISGAEGTYVGVRQTPHIWVRVTGHQTTGYYDDVSDPGKYSGVEQTDDPSTDATYDLAGGIEFYVNALYLKEANGRTDVPEGVIVRAYQSDNGPYYTFLFSHTSGPDIVTAPDACPFWNCGPDGDDVCPPEDPFCVDCANQFWATVVDVPATTDDWCGCYPVGISNAGCWPYWHGMDLHSTGIALQCIVKNFSGVMAIKNACLVLVPGGPFGMRLALISKLDGHEYKRDDDPA